MKKVTTGNLVKQIVDTAGVSKNNAVLIVNLFTNAWNIDRIGLLKSLDSGINVRKTARKAKAKKVTAATKVTTKKTTFKKNTETVPSETFPQKKPKKVLKKKSTKTVVSVDETDQ